MEKFNHNYQLVETCLQEPAGSGRTQCQLCLWRCRLKHGQRGFCQAHVNRFGKLYNLTYGIVSSIDVGAIEDKPVKHFRPGTKVLSIGSYGCNFRCEGCHNLEISWGLTALDKLAKGRSTAAFIPPQTMIQTALDKGVQGIAFTYSEPATWLEYVLDVARLAKDAGLYTVYVSNSFVTEQALALSAEVIDVLCSDIKSFNDAFYYDICKKAQVSDVLNSIVEAKRLGMHVETRTNIIPTKNDSDDNIKAIADWIAANLGTDSPWHITKFFPAYRLSHIPPTPSESLYRAQELAFEAGLRNVYVYDDKGCDCADSNEPIAVHFDDTTDGLHEVKKCAADCCGEAGVLLKKYEDS